MAEGSPAPAGGAAHHRRTYLVDRGFQLRYALLLAGAGAALALLCGLWLHQAHLQATELLPLDAEARALVERTDRELLGALVGITALMALALGVLGVLITHRVAGPVLVLGRYLQAFAAGRYPRVRALRRGDELQRLFGVFADGVEALRDRERAHADLLEDAAAAVRAALPRAPELAGTAAALAAAAQARREALADLPAPSAAAAPR
jgi:methyl-accepting chemotaxis protein